MPMFATTSADALGHLSSLLDQPPVKAGIDDMAALWEMTTIRLTCARPEGLEDYPEFSVRLRGAFGQAIKLQPSLMNWRGLVGPLPHDVLFRGVGIDRNGDERQKPIVIRGWIERNRVCVEARLFGMARLFAGPARAAMQTVLSQGISMGGSRALRVPVDVVSTQTDETAFVALPQRASSIVLTFRSPFCVRHRSELATDLRSILRAIPRRLESLAPWMALELQTGERLQRQIEEATIIGHDVRNYSWIRHSKNMGNRPIPMAGYLGKLVIIGDVTALAQAIALAEHCNAGSHASLGLGWFDAAIYAV